MILTENETFYPTPASLLDKILDGIDWKKVGSILEPSAGKGDIVKYIKEKAENYPHYNSRIEYDCIELNETLRKTLTGDELRVIHDDFLTFRTYKAYDLIVMNPPFDGDTGLKHLEKAIQLQERYGGDIICILNAESVKNPYNNFRAMITRKLEEANAQIEFMEHEFTDAERKTNVEIAVIKLHYDAPELESEIYNTLKKKVYAESFNEEDLSELAVNDFIAAIVKAYELEVEAGITLINEYKAIAPRFMPNIRPEDNKYSKPILELKIDEYGSLSVNRFIEQVRLKYWRALFNDDRIVGKMTSNLRDKFMREIKNLSNYDFSEYNIHRIQEEMNAKLIDGVEECIIALFDELTYKYAWDEFSKNIHYYDGWASNKAWIINKKVILPFYGAWDKLWNKYKFTYEAHAKLADIEKALNYLDCGRTWNLNLGSVLQAAENRQQNRNIHCKYFDVTFFKKGTMHIVFTNEELLKKLNIFGSQKKGWLPPSYGKKHYAEMTPDEKAVIDSFEGEKSYNETMADTDYYLFDTKKIPALGMKEVAA